eukprot:2674823-Rhodomonas_salina.1
MSSTEITERACGGLCVPLRRQHMRRAPCLLTAHTWWALRVGPDEGSGWRGSGWEAASAVRGGADV